MKVRGCGTRVLGGIYAEARTSPNGSPIEYFLIDPPQIIDAEVMGLSPIGVSLVEMGGVTHIFDWVGSESYPNVADFVEEVKRMGLSRRLSRSLDFSRLGPGSRIICLHSRAHIVNHRDYYEAASWNCPKGLDAHHNRHHAKLAATCAGLWWEDVTRGPEDEANINGRTIRRHMPSFDYEARTRPIPNQPEYKLAAFLSLPLTNLAVIRDPLDNTHEQAYEKASAASLPVALEDN